MRMVKVNYTPMSAVAINFVTRKGGVRWHAATKQEELI